MRLRFLGSVLISALVASSCVLKDFKKGPALDSSAGTSSGGSTTGDGAAANQGGGEAMSDVCVGMVCETPPGNACADANHLTAYDKVGGCVDGKCSYTSRSIDCECQGDNCTTDPCEGVTCDTPPKPFCSAGDTLSTYTSTGTCDAGSCDYATADESCDPATPFCNIVDNAPACVECVDGTECGNLQCVDGRCVGAPNCGVGTPSSLSTCGDGARAKSCCARTSISGGIAFNLNDDPNAPSTLSSFSLDNYEVTVGRFRQFVGSYEQQATKQGDGKNLHVAADTGWNIAWNAYMPVDRNGLRDALKCDPPSNYTWTDEPGDNENLPINCVNWYEAFAFCIWEGAGNGRLPTEAEWYRAASRHPVNGPSTYPWGNTPAPDKNHAAFGGLYYGTSALDGIKDIAPVGAIALGYSASDQADLAGNVAEWVIDSWESNFPTPCTDCAHVYNGIGASVVHTIRGGGWSSPAAEITTKARGNNTPRSGSVGFRCAYNL